METFLYIFAKTVQVIIGLASFAMLVRVIMPFFFDVEDNRIYLLACSITEPFIIPVRYIMVKLNIGQDSPIDWAFFVTSFLLVILESILPMI